MRRRKLVAAKCEAAI